MDNWDKVTDVMDDPNWDTDTVVNKNGGFTDSPHGDWQDSDVVPLDERAGFGSVLDIVQPKEWDDEPTRPMGLLQEDNLESAEMLVETEYHIVTEQDIIDDVDWIDDYLQR